MLFAVKSIFFIGNLSMRVAHFCFLYALLMSRSYDISYECKLTFLFCTERAAPAYALKHQDVNAFNVNLIVK